MNTQYFPKQKRLVAVLAMAFCGATGLLATATAQAQSAAAASQHYDIPAGSLTQVLNQFAQRAGVSLSFDPVLTAGKQSTGLKGGYTVQQGFAALLQSSGLELASSGNAYTLRRLAATGSATLPEVKVTAVADGTTEGSGSYTTRATSTATKMNLSLRETPQSISVITRQQMNDQGITQLADVFKQVTGLSFQQSGSPGSDSNAIYSRGFAVENYQIDGIPQYNRWVVQTADMAIYDRAEVVRGATGLMNGMGSAAATVNLVRKRPTQNFQASASASAGSWNYKRLDADVSAPLNEAGTLRGRFVAAVQDNDSFINRLTEKKEIFYGILEMDLTAATRLSLGFEYQKHNADGQARAGMPLFYSDGSLTKFSRSTSSAPYWAHAHQIHTSMFVGLDHQFENEWIIKANLARVSRKYDDVVGYVFGTGNALAFYPAPNTDGTGANILAGKWNSDYITEAIDIYATGPFELFGRKHEMVVGLNSSDTHFDAPAYNLWQKVPIPNLNTWDGNTPAVPNLFVTGMQHFKEEQTGVYGTARFRPTDNLSVFAGARVTDWKQTDRRMPANSATIRQENGVVTPYVGLVYDFTRDWSVYASYTDIFKPQNNKTVTGAYIDPQTGTNAEVGVKSTFFDGRLNFSAALFNVKQDNLAVRDGALLAPDGTNAFRTAQGAKTTGYELEVSGELVRDWNISAGYTQRTTKENDKNVNTEAPNNMFKMFTSYRIASIGNGLTVGGGARWQGDVYMDNSGPNAVRFTQGAYTVVDLMARYPLSKDLTLSANLNNVFDKEYYTSTTSAYYGTPRNLRVNLSYKF